MCVVFGCAEHSGWLLHGCGDRVRVWRADSGCACCRCVCVCFDCGWIVALDGIERRVGCGRGLLLSYAREAGYIVFLFRFKLCGSSSELPFDLLCIVELPSGGCVRTDSGCCSISGAVSETCGAGSVSLHTMPSCITLSRTLVFWLCRCPAQTPEYQGEAWLSASIQFKGKHGTASHYHHSNAACLHDWWGLSSWAVLYFAQGWGLRQAEQAKWMLHWM